jgi:hypothetical protein
MAATSEVLAPLLKSKGIFQMSRIVLFTLLVTSSVSWSMPAKAQSTGVAKYARQSGKASKNAAKEQRKLWKQYMKAQRESVKNANRHTKYPTRTSIRSSR